MDCIILKFPFLLRVLYLVYSFTLKVSILVYLFQGILHQHHKSSAPSPASSSSSMVSPAALKAQMELLQASTPSRHRANCSLVEADLPTRRRRGRRKNVEGLELLFTRGATVQDSLLEKYMSIILKKIHRWI